MGVDGIGGRRPLPGVGGVGASEPAAAREISGAATARASTADVSGASGSGALDQLRRGEIDLERYLDTRVADAVQHLEGRLPASQLDFIRKALREELSTDPVLVELVRRTTGSAPALETE